MVDNFINELKILCINTPLVEQVAYGDISEYNNKQVKYPYINLDIVDTNFRRGILYHTIRFYVMDRNINTLISLNKCESILDSIMKNNQMQIVDYSGNPFVLDYKDQINGYWTDIEIPEVVFVSVDPLCGNVDTELNSWTIVGNDLIKNNSLL